MQNLSQKGMNMTKTTDNTIKDDFETLIKNLELFLAKNTSQIAQVQPKTFEILLAAYQKYKDFPYYKLKIAHHGSKFALSILLLATISASMCVLLGHIKLAVPFLCLAFIAIAFLNIGFCIAFAEIDKRIENKLFQRENMKNKLFTLLNNNKSAYELESSQIEPST
jgi:hypothetical protein